MQRILVAYDDGEPARRALEQAIELAGRLGAELGVVSVVRSRAGHSAVDPWDDRAIHARALLEARRRLREAGLDADLMEPAGEVAPTIERLARDLGYDTIVVGSRGLGRVAAAIRGSVSRHVVAHADGTVIVAR